MKLKFFIEISFQYSCIFSQLESMSKILQKKKLVLVNVIEIAPEQNNLLESFSDIGFESKQYFHAKDGNKRCSSHRIIKKKLLK